MVARSEVSLIVAAAGSEAGLLNSRAFSAIVAVVLLSTLVTPSLLHFAFKWFQPRPKVVLEEPPGTNEEEQK
jgi:Kef-type K+ transport system membrane component KefB